MKQMKFSASDELREWIKQQAEKEQRSESSIVRVALYAYRNGKENGK